MAGETRRIEPGELRPDTRNANEGTARGRGMLEDSLRRLGAGRSILVDAEGNVIAGNKTLEEAVALGLPLREVTTDGSELVVVRRTDLDLDDPSGQARELAYADNRIAEVNLSWAMDVMADDMAAGNEALGRYWFPDELGEVMNEAARVALRDGGAGEGGAGRADDDAAGAWVGMPAYEHEDQDAVKRVIVNFASVEDVEAFSRLIGQPISIDAERTSLWYPKAPHLWTANTAYVMEDDPTICPACGAADGLHHPGCPVPVRHGEAVEGHPGETWCTSCALRWATDDFGLCGPCEETEGATEDDPSESLEPEHEAEPGGTGEEGWAVAGDA